MAISKNAISKLLDYLSRRGKPDLSGYQVAEEVTDQGDQDIPALVQQMIDADSDFSTVYRNAPIGDIPVSGKPIESVEDAAHYFAPMRKMANENMMALVTNEQGIPLEMLRHTKGGSAQASVFPEILMSDIASVPGGKRFYLSHNHPSGVPDPSQSDIQITDQILDWADGIDDLDYGGHLVMGDAGKFAQFHPEDYETKFGDATPMPRRETIGLSEKVRQKKIPPGPQITSPTAGQTLAESIPEENAIMMFDNQNRYIGNVPMSPEEMKNLRDNDGVRKLMARVSRSQPGAIMLKTGDKDAAKNVSKFFNRGGDIRVLDWMKPEGKGYRSDALEGGYATNASGDFKSVIPAGLAAGGLASGYSGDVDAAAMNLADAYGMDNDSAFETAELGELASLAYQEGDMELYEKVINRANQNIQMFSDPAARVLAEGKSKEMRDPRITGVMKPRNEVFADLAQISEEYIDDNLLGYMPILGNATAFFNTAADLEGDNSMMDLAKMSLPVAALGTTKGETLALADMIKNMWKGQ